LFEELGLEYYGPIDGHDLPTLIKTLKNLKAQNKPRLLHIITSVLLSNAYIKILIGEFLLKLTHARTRTHCRGDAMLFLPLTVQVWWVAMAPLMQGVLI
jgi:hypothetical protein